MRPLTEELKDLDSPVREFLDRRFTRGLPEVQRRYRTGAPALVVPGVPREAPDPGTIGTAADWLLRFVLHPRPTLWLASQGAMLYGRQAGLTGVLVDIAASLGKGYDAFEPTDSDDFIGPMVGARTHPEHLARVCWFLALLIEAYRGVKTTSAKPSLGIREAFQLISYALLDFEDVYQFTEVGIFSARYAYLSTWRIDELLNELARCPISLPATRQEFRRLLLTHR